MADAPTCLQVVVAHSPAAGVVQEYELSLPQSSRVADALAACGVLAEGHLCGIWGRLCSPQTLLQPGDRVECYHPLKVDPKVARRARFARQGARSSGLFAKRRTNSKAGY